MPKPLKRLAKTIAKEVRDAKEVEWQHFPKHIEITIYRKENKDA